MGRDDALRVTLEALIDAADEDVGTAGPDLVRASSEREDHHAERLRRGRRRRGQRVCEAILTDRARTGNGAERAAALLLSPSR